MTTTISKSELRAKMGEIFRGIEAKGNELIVTDHGRPVLKIVPIKKKETVQEISGDIQGQAIILEEDINTPAFQ